MVVLLLLATMFCTRVAQAEPFVNLKKLDSWSDSVYTLYYNSGLADQAQIDSVMFLYPADSLTEGKEKLYRILASYYHNLGKPNFAFPYLLEIEKSVRKRNDQVRLSLILAGIAECYRSFSDLNNANIYAEEAVELAEKYGSDLEKGYAHGRLGAILFEKDHRDSIRILPHFREAIKHYANLGNRDEEASYLGDYANVLYENGQKREAINLLLNAKKKMDDSARIAHLYNVLANIYLHGNKADSAVYFAKSAFKISTDLGIHTYAFNASSILQMAYDTLDSLDMAYYWSLKNNKLMNEHYEDTRGTDIRITQLEAERKTQEIENNYLRKKKEQDERFNDQNRVISFVSVAVAIIMLVVVIGLYLQRRQLIETQQLLKLQKAQTEEKNEELTKFISVRDKLISVASHDLRAPLTTLKNLLEVFKYPDISRKEIQEAVVMLEAQYERSIDMADNLLLWVKSQLQGIDPKMASFDLVALNLELLDLFKAILSTSHVKVEVKGTSNAIVYADKEMVMFVLRNLLHNAIKFTPEGGIAHIEILEFNDFIQWSVKDEGDGIKPEVLPNLFKMNWVESSSDPKRGAGLGLYLSKFFAEQNDGQLFVESNVGEGAKMILNLPKGKH